MSAILVVEQDPGYANRVVAALRAAGHEVTSAASRDEAEAAATGGPFDLVLANGMMPGAADLLGRFSKGQGGPGSVVLLPVTLASHAEAESYSADGILSKPFSDEDLERVVTGRLSTKPAPVPEPAAPIPPEPLAPEPPAPVPAPSRPAAPQPAAPQPAAPQVPAPQSVQSVRQTKMNSEIDDLLNKTLSGLDIGSLTRKRPKVKPTAPAAASSQPAEPQPTAPQPTTPQPPPPQAPAQTPAAPQAQAPQPAAPKLPEPTTPQPAAKPVSLTSTDIFGDVLAEVEAESEKTRSRSQLEPTSAPPVSPQPAAPRPPEPQTPSPQPTRRPSFDDDLDRKLEETLSGIMPSRLRRRPEQAASAPGAPPPTAPQPPASPASTPPQDFGAPPAEPAAPLAPVPAPEQPELPVEFSEDETVSIVRPVTEPREPLPSPTGPAAEPPPAGPEEIDFFATTLLATRPDSQPSTQVQPPGPATPRPAAPGPLDPTTDSSDEFEISFGEEEPAAPVDENIWSAYGNEETAGWGTTSFEAQKPIAQPPEAATQEPAPPVLAAPEPAAPEPETPQSDEPTPAAHAPPDALESSGWGVDSGWSADTAWRTMEAGDAAAETTSPDSPSEFGSGSVWEVPSFEEESTTSDLASLDSSPGAAAEAGAADFASEPPESQPTTPELAAASAPEAPSFGDSPLEDGGFELPAFEAGPSLGEDPELEFASDFAPTPEPEAPQPEVPFSEPVSSAPTFSDPPPSEPTSETASSEPASPDGPAAEQAAEAGSLGELSNELGAEDSGSFHTALRGVLQIRGEENDGTSAGDQGVPFGDYRLLERVAVGGMAEVWRARRRGVEGFQKTVAIKRILSHLTGSTDFINMFIDEAKLAAQLNHANIAQIYDLGKVDDDFFIAMEFVEGRDLRSLLREANQKGRPLPLGQALFIAAAVARALDYAHRKRDFEDRDLGLVHRDVSPQNVLVSTEGEIKLCDFGIVKAVAKASTTQMGALKGKLQYMSPEQAWGKEVDGRSDIFSLGTVMFEALTGEKLFTGDSEIGVLDAVRDCRLKSARALDPSIPESVEAILAKTLTPTPEERYQTAGEMERDIQSVLETLKPSPGQSELARYMHNLLEAPEASEEAHALGLDADTVEATKEGADEDGTAWTGTAWGTASFAAATPETDPEAVSAKIPASRPAPEPVSSRPEPASSTVSSAVSPAVSPAMSSSKVPVHAAAPAKKGGGKLIWILLLITMLAIVAVVAWTRLGTSAPSTGSPPDAAPVTAPETPGEATEPADGEEPPADVEAEAEDPEALMQQMLQEEMDRKKQEMEEQFEAQRREIERRLKEVEGDGG